MRSCLRRAWLCVRLAKAHCCLRIVEGSITEAHASQLTVAWVTCFEKALLAFTLLLELWDPDGCGTVSAVMRRLES